LHTKNTNIVWLKRDIRSQDHEPLFKADQAITPYIIIYIFEPSIITRPDTSLRHLQFIYHSILELNKTLAPFNRKVNIFYGEALDVFKYINQTFKVQNIFSHQESGTKTTWKRDKSITYFCEKESINWQESQRDGIIRGIKNRDNWNKQWHQTMHKPIIKNSYSILKETEFEHSFLIPNKLKNKLKSYPKQFQPAGEHNAWRYLKSFASKRGFNYQKHISKPTESRLSCSRLSPYLAWGNLSVKQAFQFIGTHPNGTKNSNAFSAMLTRLHWHCHFIQKFETACEYETACINKGYELLPHKKNDTYIHACINAPYLYLLYLLAFEIEDSEYQVRNLKTNALNGKRHFSNLGLNLKLRKRLPWLAF